MKLDAGNKGRSIRCYVGCVAAIVIVICLAVIAIIVLYTFAIAPITRVRIDSLSMEPTLSEGSYVVVDPRAYRDRLPERGDIVCFTHPSDRNVPYVKRVIGLPGDRVRIENGKVYINDIELLEPYLVEETSRGGNWIVPENALFVMGDNRNKSSDSRAWGPVPVDQVVGRLVWVYWPPQDWKMIPRVTYEEPWY